MARIAVDVPIFIASPSEVAAERDIAAEEIRALAAEAATHQILISPVRWETHAYPGYQRPQDAINEILKRCELVIVIFWTSLGLTSAPGRKDSGTVEELMRGAEQVFRGATDDVLVYFCTAEPPSEKEQKAREVQAFRQQLEDSRRWFFWTYTDPAHFREQVRNHLRLWFNRWRDVPKICATTLQQVAPAIPDWYELRESRLLQIKKRFEYEAEPELTIFLGAAAVRMYQARGASAAEAPLDIPQPSVLKRWKHFIGSGAPANGDLPLLRYGDGEIFFSSAEWFYFFCAAGLHRCIVNGDVTAVARREYVNSVHQYLAAIAQKQSRSAVIQSLTRWLSNSDDQTTNEPVVRNFSAYVLGMMNAVEAADALAAAAEYDEGENVRYYALTSLGKLRSRRHLQLLVESYNSTADAALRSTIGQAICRTVGIAKYEL
jgi:hypothetical protein